MRYITFLLILLCPVSLFAAQGSFNLRVLPQPPDLQVFVEFSEPSGNRILDAEETGSLKLTLKNNGRGDAFDVVANLSTQRQIAGLNFANKVNLGTVAAGDTITKTISLSTTQSLPGTAITIAIDLREANGFDPLPVEVAFQSKAFVPPQLILADLGINDQNSNARIEPMEIVELTARVQNVGRGEARQVVAIIELGNNVYLAGDSKTHFSVGDLAPGAYRDIIFSIYTNRRIANGDPIPIELKITEARSEFKRSASLSLTMNAPARQAKQMVVQAQPTASRSKDITPMTGLRVDVDHDIPQGEAGGRYDIAVVIGNRDYTSVQGVDYAIRDAQIMKQYLISTLGYKAENIIYKENATLTDFNEIFNAQLPSWIDPKGGSRVFVYYTGHGAPDLESGEAYFLPVNANPQYVSASGYAVQSLYSSLGKLKVKDLTVVLDACFSGNSENGLLFKGISPAMVKTKALTKGPKSSIVFTSAGKDQVSAWYEEKKHSLFTYYFLKGLQGDANTDKNSVLTVAEMENYLNENVPYKASRLKQIIQQPSVNGDRAAVLVIYR